MTVTYDVFIGSYGTGAEKTIHWLMFNSEKENFEVVSAVTGIDNPSFVIVNNAKTHLYAVSEVDEGEVVSYSIDYERQQLVELNRQPTKGGPCFIEIDDHDQYLFTANYGGGSVIVHPIGDNGHIGEYTDFLEYDSTKQISHPHAVKNIPSSALYAVTDLGHDKVYIYNHQDGELSLKTELNTAEGSGPRHMAFHSELKMMYVLNQDDSTVIAYSYDEQEGEFELKQILSALIEPFDGTNYCADIHISGSYLYVSNRGHHSITAYKIKGNGHLEVIANTPSGGDWPRGFNVVPNHEHVIVANEHTNNLVLMKIAENGELVNVGSEMEIDKPVCVCFLE